jgi:hypothetical protein
MKTAFFNLFSYVETTTFLWFFYFLKNTCEYKTKKRRKKMIEKINKFFKIEERKSSIKIELLGGLTTFLTMAYILFANPAIMSAYG